MKKEGPKEIIQPHMDQPCGLWCLSRGLTLHYNRLNCIGADENGSFLVVTRRKRECIRGEQTESSVDSVVVSDIAGIAEGNGRSSRLIIKDIRHRDNSPRQIAGLCEMEERRYLCPNNFGLRMTSRKRMTKQKSSLGNNCCGRGGCKGGGVWMKGPGMDEAGNRWMRRFKRPGGLLCTPMLKEWPRDDRVNPRPASPKVAKNIQL